MKLISKALTLIVFTGLIGIQFATVIDDPTHLATPDPDCPICLAANTQVCIPPHVSIGPTPDVIFYLVEKASFDQERDAYFSIHSIRAPPLS